MDNVPLMDNVLCDMEEIATNKRYYNTAIRQHNKRSEDFLQKTKNVRQTMLSGPKALAAIFSRLNGLMLPLIDKDQERFDGIIDKACAEVVFREMFEATMAQCPAIAELVPSKRDVDCGHGWVFWHQ